MYNLIRGSNNSLLLEIAVPGLRREDLQAKLEDGVLTISSIYADRVDPSVAEPSRYLVKQIKRFTTESFQLGKDMKVDMINYESGMLHILMSTKLEVGGSKIEIQ